ncbi:MAG: IS1182 family transposase, partial [Actinobacteria bacterium]|nr:IS1182 family transposase [Actinomycetota bacterium]
PSAATKRAELVVAYGTDAVVLLRAVGDAGVPAWLRELPAVEVLRVMLVQNYLITLDAAGKEVIRAREADTDGLPPGRARLSSPYDTDARWAAKGDDLYWHGYKVHITETCDDPDPVAPDGDPGGERPNIIVGVATTDATVPDARMTDPIHATLAQRDLLPAEHYLDSGYPSAALVGDSLRRWGGHAGHPAAGRSVPAGQGRRRV